MPAIFSKTLLLAACLLLPSLTEAQNGLSWSAPVAVTEAGLGNLSVRLALLPGGVPLAVWGRSGATPAIWCARGQGDAFGAPVQVNTGGQTPGLYSFAGLDVAAWGQRVFVVFEQSGLGQHIFLARSDDGGTTWQAPDTVFTAPDGLAVTISALAVDSAGNPLVSFLLQTSAETDAHVHLARSTDGGLTFPTSTNASLPAGGGQTCECCYQHILPGGGDTVFVAFRANHGNLRDMWVTRSTDGGASFDAACDVDAQDWVVNACPFSGPQLARLAGDSLLAVWMSRGTGAIRVYGSTLHGGTMNKGQEFGLPGSSGAAVYNQNHPDVAGRGDTVAMVWEETGFATGQDILCAFSNQGAVGLAANIANVTALPGSQKFPQLAYADGIFHLLYADGADALTYQRAQVSGLSAAGEAAGRKSLRLLPNPAGDFVQLERTQLPDRVDIFTPNGQLLRRARVQAGRVDVSDLPAGIYFLKTDDAVLPPSVGRFIKQ